MYDDDDDDDDRSVGLEIDEIISRLYEFCPGPVV
jgi:hypothetical protein